MEEGNQSADLEISGGHGNAQKELLHEKKNTEVTRDKSLNVYSDNTCHENGLFP